MAEKSKSASTVIAAPPATVFAILADPRQHPRIDGSGTVQSSISGPERLELGSQFGVDMKNKVPYKVKNKVVEFEPDRLIAWKHFAPHRWRYELEPTADGGTKVTETWDLSPCPGPMRTVLQAGFGKATQRGLDQTMVKLKAAAEHDAGKSGTAGL